MKNFKIKTFAKTLQLWAVITALSFALCGCGEPASDTVRNEGGVKTSSVSESNTSDGVETSDTWDSTGGSSSAAVPDNRGESSVLGSDGIPEGRGTMLSLKDGNELKISRMAVNGGNGSEEDIWTVFVYMCGSDLESIDGSATDDLMEMQSATELCSGLRFVIEADGAEDWWNDMCVSGKKQRLLISGGGCEVVYSGDSTNMGDPDTLTDFLNWGLSEYGSRHNVLDFWNHGGGSISGVCFDELHDDDSLSLKEIDAALSAVGENMSRPFELIGSDACLMATVEFANILATYGNYMVASQDLESGYGWDYTAFATALNNGAKNGGEVGESICRGYYESCVRSGEADEATLSVIDLSKLDEFLIAFNEHCKGVYSHICDENGLTDVIIAAKSALNFGGNNRSEGYTNMVDLSDFINGTLRLSENGEKTAELLENCVYYTQNGERSYKAGGLNIYYPLSVQGSRELESFKDICVSPYYISISDICAFGSNENGSIDGYGTERWLSGDSGFWSGSDFVISDFDYWEGSTDSSLNEDSGETAISFSSAPVIDEDGIYGFTLTEESLYNLDTVYCSVMLSYWDDEDNREYMLDLGTDDYVDLDYDTGECKDLFDGMWFALPDGQPICAFLVESSYEDDAFYNIYTAPIYLNGEYTNLRIMQDYSGGTAVTTVLGVWDGISESGSASRDVYGLKSGDVIEPCYYAYDAETLEYAFDFYGAAYVCEGDLLIDYDYLYDGDYYYSFEIYDYYGNAVYTDFVMFGIETDEIGNVELFYY